MPDERAESQPAAFPFVLLSSVTRQNEVVAFQNSCSFSVSGCQSMSKLFSVFNQCFHTMPLRAMPYFKVVVSMNIFRRYII